MTITRTFCSALVWLALMITVRMLVYAIVADKRTNTANQEERPVPRLPETKMKATDGEKSAAGPAGGFTPTPRAGSPLPEELQVTFGRAFNSDFSRVRIHVGSAAERSLVARAYAEGSDIFFAPGQYDPESSHGQKLIAHEAAHIVQQRSNTTQPAEVQESNAALAAEVAASGQEGALKT